MIAEMADGTKKDMYDRGFRLGFIGSKDISGTEPNKPYINNHLRFIVKYHRSETFPGSRIVGFEVEAYSVQHTYEKPWNAAAPKLTSVPLRPELAPMLAWSNEIIYTYDVVWEPSPIAWASRWDLYLYMGDDQVHCSLTHCSLTFPFPRYSALFHLFRPPLPQMLCSLPPPP
jgi:transmembrane 9 superfamily protein 2/4